MEFMAGVVVCWRFSGSRVTASDYITFEFIGNSARPTQEKTGSGPTPLSLQPRPLWHAAALRIDTASAICRIWEIDGPRLRWWT